MLQIFRSNTPAAMFYSTLLAVVLLIPQFWLPISNSESATSMSLLLPLIQDSNPWVQKGISFLLLLLAILYANFITLDHHLLGRENRLVAVLAALFISVGASFGFSCLFPVIGLFLFRFFDRCFAIQKSTYPNSLVFDASFVAAILALFYYPMIVLFPLVWLSSIYSSRIGIKTFVLSLFTLGIVIYLALGIFFLFDLPFDLAWNWNGFGVQVTDQIFGQLLLGFTALLLFLGIPSYIEALRQNKVIVRTHFMLLFWSFLPLLFVALCLQANALQILAFIALPSSIFVSNALLKLRRKWIFNLILLVLMVLAISFQIARILK